MSMFNVAPNPDDPEPRWNVELTGESRKEYGPFEDVGAATVEVVAGCLIFRGADGAERFIRAAGTWLTVSPEA